VHLAGADASWHPVSLDSCDCIRVGYAATQHCTESDTRLYGITKANAFVLPGGPDRVPSGRIA
jgi:hypothetical protein